MISDPDGRRRLVAVGSAVVDVVAYVPALPVLGGDVVATGSLVSAAGAFNVLAAATRFGMMSALLGRHGIGPNGDILRAACLREDIEILLPPTEEGDTGFCMGLVDAHGERTYVTIPGVDAEMNADDLQVGCVRKHDVVYMSGYELAFAHGADLTQWLVSLPRDIVTFFDPGPLISTLPADLLHRVMSHVHWCSLNEHEALSAVSRPPAQAGDELMNRYPQLQGVVIRTNATGCWLRLRDGRSTHVQALSVLAVDTTGAGDCHVGTFIASIAEGHSATTAARMANHAAGLSVTARGPASGPLRLELDRALQMLLPRPGV